MKTGIEISSGGVIFRKGEKGIEVALITPKGKENTIWCLAKGLVEKGESINEAAVREVFEETGLKGKVLDRIDRIHYWYIRKVDGESIRFYKIVYFFLMELREGDKGRHDEEVAEVRWFPIDEALKVASYKGEREILKKSKEMLLRMFN